MLVEFIFRFHIGYYNNGQFISDKNLIAKKYLRETMTHDIISFFAFLVPILYS